MGLKSKTIRANVKFENLIIYLSSFNMPFMCLKKLAKLLYFIDFTYFEKNDRPITGVEYVKQSYGPMPLPKVFYSVIEQLEKEDKIKLIKAKGDFETKIPVAQKKPNMELFSEDEQQMINVIKDKYFNNSANEVENIAKGEPPYKMTLYKEKIPYHLAYYRNSFGEMDLDGDGDESMDLG